MSGDRDVINEPEPDTTTIRTKPCWICGQHSYITIPQDAWKNHDLYDVPLDVAWPDGPEADKRLMLTGIHLKCWDEEFPDDTKENNNA